MIPTPIHKLTTKLLPTLLLALSTLLTPQSKADGLLCDARDFIGSHYTPGFAKDVTIEGTTAYLTVGEEGLQILDVSNPSAPSLLGVYNTPGFASHVTVVGTTAYVADYDSGLQIIDVSDPTNPLLLGSWMTPQEANDVEIVETTAYIACGQVFTDGSLQIIDVSDPAVPFHLGSWETTDSVIDVDVIENTAYVSLKTAGFSIIDVSNSASPTLIGSTEVIGGQTFRRLAISGTTVYLGDRDYLRIYDTSDPATPTQISQIDLIFSYCNDVSVVGTKAYVLISGALLVYNIATPSSPHLLGSYGLPNAQKVSVIDTTAFIASGSAGMQVVDVSNPKTPRPFVSIDTLSAAQDVVIENSIAYVSEWSTGLQVFDVSLPGLPALLSTELIEQGTSGVAVQDATVYTTSRNKVYIFDATDPTKLSLLNTIDLPGATGVTVVGTTLYVACGESGFHIIDVSDPSTPVILASRQTVRGAHSITVHDSIAYIVLWSQFVQMVDVSNPTAPLFLGRLVSAIHPVDVAIIGTTACMIDTGGGAHAEKGLHIYDVSDPRHPVRLEYLRTGGSLSITAVGTTAVLSQDYRLVFYDVSNPSKPIWKGSYLTPGVSNDVYIHDTNAYIATQYSGLLIYDLSDCSLCPADINGDKALNIFDISAFLTAFVANDPITDLNSDGQFDFFDISAFLTAFAAGCP